MSQSTKKHLLSNAFPIYNYRYKFEHPQEIDCIPGGINIDYKLYTNTDDNDTIFSIGTQVLKYQSKK